MQTEINPSTNYVKTGMRKVLDFDPRTDLSDDF
jgi:hypothetical protein